LLDPDYAISRSIGTLEDLAPVLTGRVGNARNDAELGLSKVRNQLSKTFGLRGLLNDGESV
jgi:hypothetical protein